jgi:hypothetical protein
MVRYLHLQPRSAQLQYLHYVSAGVYGTPRSGRPAGGVA